MALLDDGPFLASMFALVDEALQQRGTARGAVRESIVVYYVMLLRVHCNPYSRLQ